MPTLRIEYIKLLPSVDGTPDASAIQKVLAEIEMPITSTATDVTAQAVAPAGATHAIVYAAGAACYVDWTGNKAKDSNPAPQTAPRMYIPSGDGRMISVKAQATKIGCILSSLS